MGLQIIAARDQDALVPSLAAAYEATAGWRLLPPPPCGPSGPVISDSSTLSFSVTIRQNWRKQGATMRAGVSAAIVAASLLGSGTAFSACPPGHSRAGQPRAGQPNNCLDLDLVPQISQQIGASEHIATRPKTAPPSDQKPAYTGPTVGVSRTVRQAPTVGYRWAID